MLDDAHVAAVEALGQAQENAQHPHDFARALVERGELRVLLARQRLAVEERGGRHDRLLGLVEAEQLGVADDVRRMRVVVVVREEHAQVVHQRRVAEQLALPVAEPVQPQLPRGVEELQRQALDRPRVRLVEPAGPAELQDAALAEPDRLQAAVLGAREVLDQQPVAQPALAHAEVRELQLLHQHVEHRRSADDDVRALRVHARHAAALLRRERTEQADDLAQLLAGERVILAPGPLAEEPRGDLRQVTMVPDEPMAMSNLCCRSFWTARTLMLRT